MTLQEKIYDTIWKAKFFSTDLFSIINSMNENGEDTRVIQNKFILLNKWIEILQFYYDNNFGENGVVTPIEECLTEKQVEDLISKVKSLIGNNRYSLAQWLLSYGFFRDGGIWVDQGEVWLDYPIMQ